MEDNRDARTAAEPAYRLTTITSADDAALARIIRANLRQHSLDHPGTAYFDPELDHLSAFYLADGVRRHYAVLRDANGEVVGGVGLAECDVFENCAELQKLYLADEVKGQGLGYKLVAHIEETAAGLGYGRMYLETHTNLSVAMHLYERCGFKRIDKPRGVVHSAMNRFYVKELLPVATNH